MIDSPWLPSFPSCENIWSRGNLGCWGSCHKCLTFGLPCGQLLEGIRLYVKGIFLASIEDNIATGIGLKDIVSVEGFGTILAESQFGDTSSRGGQVDHYYRLNMALKDDVGDKIQE